MRLSRVLALVGFCVLFSTVTFADDIPVVNPSFETLPSGAPPLANSCGSGCSYEVGTVPGWTVTGYAGEFQPGATTAFNSLPDGPTIAYVNAGGSISQTLGATTVSGDTYTLQLNVGERTNITADPLVYLVIGGTDILATGTAPTAGNWSTYTATFTCSGTCTSGESIAILLESTGISSQQAEYDNVQMSVPEPGVFSMLLLGLAGLGVLGWRRKHPALAVS